MLMVSFDYLQISDVMCDAGTSCGVESICLYGGTSKGPQIAALKSGVVSSDIPFSLKNCLLMLLVEL